MAAANHGEQKPARWDEEDEDDEAVRISSDTLDDPLEAMAVDEVDRPKPQPRTERERLLDEDGNEEDIDEERETGHAYRRSYEAPDKEESKSTLYLMLLTIPLGGLQFTWMVEMLAVTPFLLSLGLTKSLMALVWCAGPLSGTVVQPYVGIKSDNYRGRWGRRRPFIVAGAFATLVSLLALSWTRQIVGGFLGIFGVDRNSRGTRITSQIWAVIFVYVLDFAVNFIQAGVRAYIVDCAPTHQQEEANGWANRMMQLFNIIGNAFGFLELTSIFPFLGDTQFKVLCALALVVLGSTVALSCATVKEKDPWTFGPPSNNGGGLFSFFVSLYHSVRHLPPQVRRVCIAQVFSWIAWFPFLFYTSTYVSNLYAEPFFAADPNLPPERVDQILEEGTRAGAYALLTWAITSFVASLVLPLLLIPSHAQSPESPLARLGLPSLRIPGFTLRRAWFLSHIVFGILMWLTYAVYSPAGATALVGAMGVPWTLTNWAPYALIAADISERDDQRADEAADAHARESGRGTQSQRKGSDQAGVVLGIHNVAIAAPQVVSTLASSAIFHALQEPRGKPGDDSVGWVFRAAGLCALIAAVFIKRVYEGGSARHTAAVASASAAQQQHVYAPVEG